MDRAEARQLVAAVAADWAADPDSDVVWAGEHEGRLGVRMAQRARDFTTVWFDVGDRTVAVEAYVLPAPTGDVAEVYRQCLRRNERAWRVRFALDRHGDVFLLGRVALAALSADELDAVLGEIYEAVEVAFRGLARAGFARREKSP